MAIDRDTTLKKAEKLLRQGKLEGAIAEYVRLVEEQPQDWNSINALGDLYSRAGKIDHAVAQFTRIADHLYAEGFLPKAAALYKKNFRIKADDEHTLLRLSEIATRQGVLVDAKHYLRKVGDRRKARGDERGAAEVLIQLGGLDPNDAEIKTQAARAAQSLGDIDRACGLMMEAAEIYEKQQRAAEALAVLGEALALDPSDGTLRDRLLTGLIARGDIDRVRSVAKTSGELLKIADALEAQGRGEDALDILIEAALLAPDNMALRTRVARECINAGKFAEVRTFLTLETAGNDPDLLRALARLELQAGHLEEGRAALIRLVTVHPGRRDDLVYVACDLIDYKQVEAAFLCVELVADTALLEQDWGGAASALHEFVTRVPNHIPALMRLLDICVDGGLESTMYMAQAQLADAYLEAGQGAEARVIAEDLVAREPWVRANVERFRRALILLAVPDPDAVIAERLSGESPFLSTDDSFDMPASSDTPTAIDTDFAGSPTLASPALSMPPQPDTVEMTPRTPGPSAPAAPEPGRAGEPDAMMLESTEVDLSDALSDLDMGTPAASSATPRPLEDVFDDMRAKARDSQLQNAQAQYAAGIDHANHGRVDQAILAFEAAVRMPLLRFQAGSRLGRLHIARGDLPTGIEWFERAAEAPPPNPEEGHELMYELADALERTGEGARALAVLLELHAVAGSYRDVASRIDRLAKVQARR